MSESNSKRRRPNRLTNVEFLAICDLLRNHAETVMSECHQLADVAKFVKDKLGKDVALHSLSNCLKATGVRIKLMGKSAANESRYQNLRILSLAILSLYEKLGESVPADLAKLIEKVTGKPVAQKKAALPIPVGSVPPPHTIPVVNRRQ